MSRTAVYSSALLCFLVVAYDGGYASVPRLLKCVPPERNGALIRICVRDHFVLIFTDKGVHSIRMRFRDALADLSDDLGVLVHRSHWVAADQIDKTFKKDRKLFARLKTVLKRRSAAMVKLHWAL